MALPGNPPMLFEAAPRRRGSQKKRRARLA
jgi:hypothetical protein